jgi:hypothetical protein
VRALFLACSLLLATPALAATADDVSAAINQIFGDSREFERAFAGIQGAVVDHDPEFFASFVAYPITVMVDGEEMTIEDSETFVENYDAIMTDDIVEAVSNQAYEDLFVNDEGVMFGDGQLWINGVCFDDQCSGFDVKIVTIQSTSE